jgi:hypothetical protein
MVHLNVKYISPSQISKLTFSMRVFHQNSVCIPFILSPSHVLTHHGLLDSDFLTVGLLRDVCKHEVPC